MENSVTKRTFSELKAALRRWHKLTIRDNFLFQKTMQEYPELCKKLCELIIGRKIVSISFPAAEKTIKMRRQSKGIRLDVYVVDNRGRVINIEMQPVRKKNLPKRMRIYQGLIDLDWLEQGHPYDELNETWIVFICNFDPFRERRSLYTFHTACDEVPQLKMKDGSTKVFLNAKGQDDEKISQELRAFLDYVAGKPTASKFVRQLAEAVQSVKQEKKWRLEYMVYDFEMYDRENKGREEGRKEGRKEGRREGLKQGMLKATRNLMETLGLSAQKALDALKISPEEQARLMPLLQ